MIRATTLVLTFLLVIAYSAQAQNFIWARGAGSASSDQSLSMDIDASGNAIMVGSYFATLEIDSLSIPSTGSEDFFIFKYNTDGDLLWVTANGGTFQDQISSVAVDPATNEIYVAGYVRSQNVVLGPDTISANTGLQQDIFVAKLDSNGNFLWAETFAGSGSDVAVDLTVDSNGDIILLGYFQTDITVGGTTYTATSTFFPSDYVLVKLDDNGNVQWSNQIEANSSLFFGFGTRLGGVDVLSNNDIIATGSFRDSLVVDNNVLTNFSGGFDTDIWMARFDAGNGSVNWVQKAGGLDSDLGNQVVVDSLDRIFFTGRTAGAVTFDTISVPSGGNSSVYLAQFDTAGSAIFAIQTGGSSFNDGIGIDVDGQGNVYLTGRFFSSILFGNILLATTNFGSRFFVAKYDYLNENWDWAVSPNSQSGLSPQEEGRDIDVDGEDNVFVAGNYSNLVSLAGEVLISLGGNDVFLTKVGDCSTLTSNFSLTGDSNLCTGESTLLQADTSTFYEYQWLFNNAVLPGQITDQYVANQGGAYQLITDSSGCKDTSSVINITVSAIPTVTLSAFTNVCEDDTPSILSGGLPTGGVYSGSGVSGGVFTPASAGTGTHPITYTFTNGSGCSDDAAQNIQVGAAPFVFMQPVTDVCDNDVPFTLTSGIPGGGTYSGSGVFGGSVFDPSSAGLGTTTVYYTRTATNGCTTTDSVDITVNGVPSAALAPFSDVCISTTFIPLVGGSPFGGVYSGPGVSTPFFFPVAAGAGSHDITYTVTANGCSADTTQSIFVDIVPDPLFAPLPAYCENDNDVDLSPFAFPTGGVFSGPAVVDSAFSPQVFGVGSDTIVYTLTNSCGSDTAQRPVTVNANPTVTLAPIGPFCLNDGLQPLTGGSPLGGAFSGDGVVGGTFNPATAGIGSHLLTYVFTNSSGCSDSASQTVTVNALPTVTLSALADVCVNAGSFALSGGNPSGGTYLGTGVSGGNFDPATAGVGTYTITYAFSDGNGCSDSAQQTITVNPLPTVTLTSFSNVCQNAGVQTLGGGSPLGGSFTGVGVSSGNFDPATAGVGTHTITYSFTDGNGCSNTAQQTITVDTVPVVTLTPFAEVCVDAGSFALNGGSPSSGTYSGNGVSSGSFDPSSAGVGSHTITYTYTDGNGCADSAQQTITVNPLPTVTLSAFSDVCVDDASFPLSGESPSGGTFSGTGVSAGNFNPQTAGVGSTIITYTFLDANGCADSAQQNIIVNASPVVTQSAFSNVCLNGGSVALSGGSPSGGSYSGTGVSGGSFDPQIAGVGTFTITYTVTVGSGCSDSAQQTITVDSVPVVTLAAFTDVCIGAGTQTLSGGDPVGGAYSGIGVSSGDFDPATAGLGSHTITYIFTDGNGCLDSAQQTITVNPLPTVTLAALSNVCVDAGSFALSGGSPISGVFSGTGVNAGDFDPAAAGVGTHTITYTFIDGNGCADSAQQTITVDSLPTVTLSALNNVCFNGGTVTLAGGNPTGGTYSGTGVSSGTFDPTTAGLGSHTITYTFTDGNGCADSAQQTLTVDSVPVVTLTAFTDVCIDAGNFALTGGAPLGGTFSGTGVSSGMFDPSAAGVGSYILTYIYTDGNGCLDSAQQTITVNPLPTVTLAALSNVCVDAGSFALSGGSPISGVFSGTGVNAGDFDPAAAGVGTHTITYTVTDGNGCADSAQQTITVDSLPTVTLSALNNVCFNGGTVTLAGGNPTGGTYSGTGVSSGTFDPATAGLGSHTITYTFTDGNGCADSAQQTLTVDTVPVVTLTAFTDVCIDAGIQTLSGGDPVGGNYSGTGVSSGDFDPATAGLGSHTITYIYTDGNGCLDSAQQTITVNPLPTVTLAALSNVCVDAGSFALSGGSPISGVFSGTGVNAGDFDPAAAGVGTHTITYTFIDGNGCADSAQQTITVDSLPTVTLSALNNVCFNGGTVTLTGGNPTGGTYSGTGVSSGTFDPAIAGLGSHTITYTFTDGNGCADSAQQTLTVDTVPVVTLTAFNDVCIDAGLQTLSGGDPVGGTYSGTGVSAGNFDPTVATVGSHTITYTYTDGNGCLDSAQQTITVNPLPTVTLSAFADVCIDAGTFTLSGGSPANGTYSGSGVTAGDFDPQLATAGTHVITYTFTDANGCTDSAQQNLTVNPLPVVTLSSFSNVCLNAGLQTLTGGAPLGGTYNGIGVSVGDFDPVATGVGTHTITYLFADVNGCSDSAQQTITVDTVPVVTLTPFADVCVDAGSFALSGGDPLSGSYSGTGVIAGNFDPAVATVGSHTITYTYTDGSGCLDSAQQTISVNPLPMVTFTGLGNICSNDSPLLLSGGSPAGGSYFGSGVTGGPSAVLDPAIPLPGDVEIGYAFVSSFGCVDTAYDTITVDSVPIINFSFIAAVCANVDTISLGAPTPTGGTFAGNHVFGDAFAAVESGPGMFPVSYTFTDGQGCTGADTQTVTVDTLPLVSLAITTDSICEFSPVPLNGEIPLGGVFSGDSVVGDTLFTADLQFTQMITYTYTDANGCVDSAMDVVWVYPDPGIVFTDDTINLCPGTVIPLDFADPFGGQFLSSFIDTIAGTLTAPDTAFFGEGGVYSFGNVCGFDQDTFYLNVWPQPLPDLGADTFICNTSSLSLSPGAFDTYLWSDASSDASVVVNGGPDTLFVDQSISVTVTDVNGCMASDSILVEIEDNPAFDLGPPVVTICSDSVLSLTVSATYDTYSWSNGNLSATSLIYNGAADSTLKYAVQVTGSNPLGCSYTDTMLVIVSSCDSLLPPPTPPAATIIERLYPNPAWDYFIVDFTTPVVSVESVNVIAASGTSALSTEANVDWTLLDEDQLRVNLVGLAGGVYVVEVKANGQTYRDRVIIR